MRKININDTLRYDRILDLTPDYQYISKNGLFKKFFSFDKWCYRLEDASEEVHIFDIYKREHLVLKKCRCMNKLYAFPREPFPQSIAMTFKRTKQYEDVVTI